MSLQNLLCEKDVREISCTFTGHSYSLWLIIKFKIKIKNVNNLN